LHFLPINYKGKHANGRGQEVQEEKGAGKGAVAVEEEEGNS